MGDTHEPYEGWTILELFGHRRLAGWVSEAELAGGKFIRIDVPGLDGHGPRSTVATQFYGPAAIYAITPTTEAMARAVARTCQPEPVHRWEMPPDRALAATTEAPRDDDPPDTNDDDLP